VYGTEHTFGTHTVDFVIPTGAFGNAMGGFLAKLMGLPIGKIVCATNENDLVVRTIKQGDLCMRNSLEVGSRSSVSYSLRTVR
jgi:threonine synthase